MFQQNKARLSKNRSIGSHTHKRSTHGSHYTDLKNSFEFTHLPPPPPPPPQYHMLSTEVGNVSADKPVLHLKSEHKAKSNRSSYITPCGIFSPQSCGVREGECKYSIFLFCIYMLRFMNIEFIKVIENVLIF